MQIKTFTATSYASPAQAIKEVTSAANEWLVAQDHAKHVYGQIQLAVVAGADSWTAAIAFAVYDRS